MAVQIIRLSGKDIQPYLSDLAQLRIKIFHDYPYLYEGNMDEEKKYLTTYMNCEQSVLILAIDNKKVVGASTAIPLSNETVEIITPFKKAKMDIDKIFYLGESVLMHEYRGQKIGPRFFAEREAAAREQGFPITAFCAVQRSDDDPRRPKDFHPLDKMWKGLGYVKHPELNTYFSWKEIGETVESNKPMTFWMKQL